MDLSIFDIISILLKRIWIILLCTVIGCTGAFLISTFLINPKYSATCQMYVNTGTESTTGNANADYVDLQYAQKLVNSYIIILKNDIFLENVASVSKLPYTPTQIRDMLTLSSIKPISSTRSVENIHNMK